jgi:hypothetical protein
MVAITGSVRDGSLKEEEKVGEKKQMWSDVIPVLRVMMMVCIYEPWMLEGLRRSGFTYVHCTLHTDMYVCNTLIMNRINISTARHVDRYYTDSCKFGLFDCLFVGMAGLDYYF